MREREFAFFHPVEYGECDGEFIDALHGEGGIRGDGGGVGRVRVFDDDADGGMVSFDRRGDFFLKGGGDGGMTDAERKAACGEKSAEFHDAVTDFPRERGSAICGMDGL